MATDDKYFELLLTEKKLADSMVGGYADLSLKVFGMFGAGGVLLGWLVSKDAGNAWSPSIGIACVALAVASCGILVQGIGTYSLTLGYIQYRNEYLNEAFRTHLNLQEPPIQAVRRWRNGAARRPTTLANVFIGILHAACCIALLITAAYCLPHNFWSVLGVLLGWCSLVGAVITECELLLAMKEIFDRN